MKKPDQIIREYLPNTSAIQGDIGYRNVIMLMDLYLNQTDSPKKERVPIRIYRLAHLRNDEAEHYLFRSLNDYESLMDNGQPIKELLDFLAITLHKGETIHMEELNINDLSFFIKKINP